MDIGKRIKERREELGMSQDELAKKVGYKSRSSINKIEMDGRGLPHRKIVAFAKALDVTPDYFLDLDDFAVKIASIESRNKALNYDNKERHELLVYYYDRLSRNGRDALMDILSELRALNSLGQKEAVKRVRELTEISCYTEPQKSPFSVAGSGRNRLNAAIEHTNNDINEEIKNTEDFIAAVRTITRAQLDYINATDDTGSPEQKSAASGISIDKEKAEVNGKFPFKLKSTSGTVVQPSQLVDAAHERTSIEVTEGMKKHDNDIMDDKNF